MKVTYLHFLFIAVFSISCNESHKLPRLHVSENGHHLVQADGAPFYWIGDTGWAMFQQLTREEVNLYLDDRKSKGFTVIQSVAFWYPHGAIEPLGPLNPSNAYGHRPFHGPENDPETSRPLLEEAGSAMAPNDYWDHADYIIEAVKERDLILVLLPCWGNAFINNRMRGSKIEFDEDEARVYGRFLGERYQSEDHIIWCLGGDVDPVNFGDQNQLAVYRAMAEGIGQGVSGNDQLSWDQAHQDWDKTLMTFHAVRTPKHSGAEGGSSSVWFHDDPWLDLNMMETFKWVDKVHPYVTEDYTKQPTKPTVLGEGAYEVGMYGNDCHWVTPHKVRQQGYHAFFAGGAGYTYGHWSIWPFRGAYCDVSWQAALNAPGAMHIAKILKEFISELELFSFIPDQSIILSENPSGEDVQCAMIHPDDGRILIYLPINQPVEVDLSRLKGNNRPVTWIDPATGNKLSSEFDGEKIFTPPLDWEDAILLIE